jgi:hypothetical protein
VSEGHDDDNNDFLKEKGAERKMLPLTIVKRDTLSNIPRT